MLDFISHNIFTILTTIIGGLLTIDRWIKARETKELKIQHDFELVDIKAENYKLTTQLKYDSDYDKMYQSVLRVEKEMQSLREKASERHGEVQGRIGSMELRMNEFIFKHTAQIDELFRITDRRLKNPLDLNN